LQHRHDDADRLDGVSATGSELLNAGRERLADLLGRITVAHDDRHIAAIKAEVSTPGPRNMTFLALQIHPKALVPDCFVGQEKTDGAVKVSSASA